MADYLATNTKRLKIQQTGPRGTHHMIIRFPEVESDANVLSQARAICEGIKAFCVDGTSWASAEIAHEGSDVFLPFTWGAAITSASGSAASNLTPYGAYVNFIGRSTAGSRVAFYIFNVDQGHLTANNRLTIGESAVLAACLPLFAGPGINTVAIDQNPFVMKQYANTGINDKVAKKSRSIV